jgi:repressor of nif and glnA expression
MDRIGLAVIAGLTPIAALAEHGIPVHSKAMSALVDFAELVPFSTL